MLSNTNVAPRLTRVDGFRPTFVVRLRLYTYMGIIAVLGMVPVIAAALPDFEVASIRLDTRAEAERSTTVLPGGRLSAVHLDVRKMIRDAFDVEDYQISGAPGGPIRPATQSKRRCRRVLRLPGTIYRRSFCLFWRVKQRVDRDSWLRLISETITDLRAQHPIGYRYLRTSGNLNNQTLRVLFY